jgi:hypothetical protein
LAAGFSSLLSALCYAEFAARVPLSGSAYTFAYMTLGEITAWFIGWNLTLEYGVSAAAVARGWSSYFGAFLTGVGADVPSWLAGEDRYLDGNIAPAPFAFLIVAVCTGVLLFGVQESSMFNNVITVINVSLLLFIIIFGAFHVNPANWTDNFAPWGAKGVFQGAAIVFFSYIGFDSVSTLSGEVKNPGRNLPIGVVGTLLIATLLYVGISLVVTGMIPYTEINKDKPLAETFQADRLSESRHRRRRRRRHDDCRHHALLAARTAAHLLPDGDGRSHVSPVCAGVVAPRASCRHARHRHRRRRPRHAAAARVAHRCDQHWHAAGVCRRLRRPHCAALQPAARRPLAGRRARALRAAADCDVDRGAVVWLWLLVQVRRAGARDAAVWLARDRRH